MILAKRESEKEEILESVEEEFSHYRCVVRFRMFDAVKKKGHPPNYLDNVSEPVWRVMKRGQLE